MGRKRVSIAPQDIVKRPRQHYSKQCLRGMRDVWCAKCGFFKSGMSEQFDELALIRHQNATLCETTKMRRIARDQLPPESETGTVISRPSRPYIFSQTSIPFSQSALTTTSVVVGSDEINDVEPSNDVDLVLQTLHEEPTVNDLERSQEETEVEFLQRLKDFEESMYIKRMQDEMMSSLGNDQSYNLRNGNTIEDFLSLSLFGIDANISYEQGDSLLSLIKIICERHYGTDKPLNMPVRWDTIVAGINRKIMVGKRLVSNQVCLDPTYFGVKDDKGKRIVSTVVDCRDIKQVLAKELLLMNSLHFAAIPVV